MSARVFEKFFKYLMTERKALKVDLSKVNVPKMSVPRPSAYEQYQKIGRMNRPK